MKVKVLIAAGGTGGHIYPGITVAQTLVARNPEVDVLFVGAEGGLEEELVTKAGFPFEGVSARYLQRRVSIGALKTGWTALKGLGQSLTIVRRFRPSVALGTGGYVSGPVMAAARLSGIPTIIQEQNAYPGLTSRLLGRFVHTVALGTEEAARHFRRAKRVETTGNPIRRDILVRSRDEGRRAFGLQPNRRTLLVFGGSQGGATLNRAVLHGGTALLADGAQILWQTGRGGFEDVIRVLSERTNRDPTGLLSDNPSAPVRFGHLHVLPFIDDMGAAYAAADLVFCRAGAITLAELTARGLPALLVPYPFASEGHQLANARAVERAGGARVILDGDVTEDTLATVVTPLLRDEETLGRMAAASRSLGRPDAAERVAKLVEQTARR